MKRLILLASLLALPLPAGAQEPFWPVRFWGETDSGLTSGGGSLLGPLAWCVITQVADDASPSIGVIGGCAADTGGNVLETSSANTGPLAIADLDVPVAGMILYVVGMGGTDPSTIADAGNFNLEREWIGVVDNVLILYVQADNDYVEVGRRNGIRYFDDQVEIGAGDVDTDFPNSQLVSGQSDTGEINSDRVGVVGEAASDGTDESRGVAGYAKTSSAQDASGVLGIAHVGATGDASTAYGGIFSAADTHAGGPNVALLCQASGSGTANYCFEINAGDINSIGAVNWVMLDNSAAALSWDAVGADNILLVSSVDGEETVAFVAKGTVASSLDAATGDEYAIDLAYTTAKASSGDDYGLRITKTDTASPGTSYLFWVGVGASPMAFITDTGGMTLDGTLTTGGLTTLGGDIDTDGYGVCAYAPDTDVAPDDLVTSAGSALSTGSTAAGANHIVTGGEGRMTITVDTTGGAEVGVTVTQICRGAALAALTEGVNFACSGLTDAQCAANLAVAVAAQTGTCVTATSAAAVAYPQPIDCAAYGVSFASANGAGGGTAFVVDNGTDGGVVVPTGTRVYVDGGGDTYIIGDDNEIEFFTGGARRLLISTTQIAPSRNINISNYIRNPAGALKLGGDYTPVTMPDVTGNAGFFGEIEVAGLATFISAITVPNSGLHMLDTNASHDLIYAVGSDLTADRTLTFTTGDAARTVTLSADLTVEATSFVNQDLTSDASPTFADVTFAAYTRHHDFTAGALASVGVGAPVYACCGSLCGPGLDHIDEVLAKTVEIPPEWDGASDMTIHIHAVPTDSDPIADTEDIDLDFEWRSVAANETGKTGAVATVTDTYLQSGGAGAECDVIFFSATVPYTGGNQPLTVDDDLGIKINRNPGAEANSYSGSLIIHKAELLYTATGKATH